MKIFKKLIILFLCFAPVLFGLNSKVHNFIRENKVKKQSLKQSIDYAYRTYYDYLRTKYNQEYPDLRDSLYYALKKSGYYNSRKEKWESDYQNTYLLFRMEYEYLKKRYSYDFTKVSKTKTYQKIEGTLIDKGYKKKEIEDVFKAVTKYDFTPIHFYYRPKSVKEQIKLNKLRPENVNFQPIKKFFTKYKQYLENAEKKYKVNKEIITAILYKETRLGKVPLNFKPMEALLVQALFKLTWDFTPLEEREKSLDRMKRLQKSARNSLVHLVAYCLDNKLHPDSISSNFVGAIGYPQFMPFNLYLAKDGDGDGKAELNKMPDAIMSVGNFFYQNGWRKNVDLGLKDKDYVLKQIRKYNQNSSYMEAVYLIARELKIITN